MDRKYAVRILGKTAHAGRKFVSRNYDYLSLPEVFPLSARDFAETGVNEIETREVEHYEIFTLRFSDRLGPATAYMHFGVDYRELNNPDYPPGYAKVRAFNQTFDRLDEYRRFIYKEPALVHEFNEWREKNG